jgi:hypothetical protein
MATYEEKPDLKKIAEHENKRVMILLATAAISLTAVVSP